MKVLKTKNTEKTWDTVEYESNNIFPVGKNVNIHLAAKIIRAIFVKEGEYYPQLFLDDGLYTNVRV